MRGAALLHLCVFVAACGGSTSTDDGGSGIDAARPDAAADASVPDAGVPDAPCTTDADGDGHRSTACGGDDCDDADANRYTGNTEVCDPTSHDEDCDPSTFGFRDSDGDGYGDMRCCNGTTCGTDCDDANTNVHPSQTETCNAVDDNCNGMIDEGAAGTSYTPDCDGDGFGDATATPTVGCSAPTTAPTCAMPAPGARWVTNATDCNDVFAMVHPGAAGTCDCATDAGDHDHDGHVATACGGGDCAEMDATIHDGAVDTCDAIDNDCDGVVDYPTAVPCVTCESMPSSMRLGCSGGDVCCVRGFTSLLSCITPSDAATVCPTTDMMVQPFACDGPEDCAAGERCCVANGPPGGSACGASCSYREACHRTADCTTGTCMSYESTLGYLGNVCQ